MPWGLTRFQHSGQSHFVTFCCYHRRRLFTAYTSRRIFESGLQRVRRIFRLQVYGYVIMPEHVHLLLSEPQLGTSPLKPKPGLSGPPVGLTQPQQHSLADALKSLKQGVSRRLLPPQRAKCALARDPGLIDDADHFWQKRYYDFNIRNYAQFVEKLKLYSSKSGQAGRVRAVVGLGVEQFSPRRNWL